MRTNCCVSSVPHSHGSFEVLAQATNASMLDLDLPIKYAYAFRIGHAELLNPHEFGIF